MAKLNDHIKVLIASFGQPDAILCKQYIWNLRDNLKIVGWNKKSGGAALVFRTSAKIDARQYDWRADDQPEWFHEMHPGYDGSELSWRPGFSKFATIEEWLNNI